MPILFHCGSLYGWLRDWMGLENLSIALMTERGWVEEMMEHLTRMDLELIAGKEAIDRELEKLRPLVERGGYLPCVDHRVPPDVTYENYLYYLERKKAIL